MTSFEILKEAGIGTKQNISFLKTLSTSELQYKYSQVSTALKGLADPAKWTEQEHSEWRAMNLGATPSQAVETLKYMKGVLSTILISDRGVGLARPVPTKPESNFSKNYKMYASFILLAVALVLIYRAFIK